jgi:FkbH-like protein
MTEPVPSRPDDPLTLRELSLTDLLAAASRAERDAAAAPHASPLRVAIIGGYTTRFVAKILGLFLRGEGISAEVWEAPYGPFEQSVLTPDSGLYEFDPQVVLLLTHSGNLKAWPELFAERGEVDALATAEAGRWAGYWESIRSRCGAHIVQTNFDAPRVRPLGNLDAGVPYGRSGFIETVNRGLVDRLVEGVTLLDFAHIKAGLGLRQAEDLQSQLLHGQPYRFELLGPLCFALGRHISAVRGGSRKCLVLDLDDTIWGGVVGDDGVEGLVLGATSPVGEAFVRFQRYVRALKSRGVVLAVCSKNDEVIARQAFDEHPEMVLSMDDIACFVANWDDKAVNLCRIAETLNLGLDALVLVDDNPRERHRVREALPEVGVVELPDDPADYVQAVAEGAWFELASLTADGARRADAYRDEGRRDVVRSAAVDYEAYLRDLGLKARVEALGPGNLQRVAELVGRTNQWNLRTIRHSVAELEAFAASQTAEGFCVRLADRFGDYGLISFVLLVREGDEQFIDTWLMSCRVFSRTVEHLVFEELVDRAIARGAKALVGEHRPTAKNGPVSGLFEGLGFTAVAVDGDDEASVARRWSLSLEPRPPTPPHHIQRENS